MAMFVQLFAVLNVGATTTDFSKNLITHWDFEGDNPLADKATNGSSSDTLETNGTVNIANGAATVSNLSACYMEAAGAETTDDLYSMQNKTIIMKFKVEDIDVSCSHVVTPIFKKGGLQVQLELFDTTDMQSPYDAHFRVWDGGSAGANRITNAGGADTGNWTGADGKFHYMILSYSYDSATGKLTQNAYYSTSAYPKTTDDFTHLYTETLNASENVLSYSSPLLLGKAKADESNRRAGFVYDDIKIYDVAMTIEDAYSTLDIDFDKEAEEDADIGSGDTEDNDTELNDTEANDTETNGNVSNDTVVNGTDTEKTEGTTTDTDVNGTDDGGCGSVIAIPGIALASAIIGAFCIFKRREE